MFKEQDLQKLSILKSYLRAKNAQAVKWTNPKNMVRLANYPSQLNPNSNIAKYPPKHLTSTTMDWHKFLESANLTQLRGRR